MKKMMGQITDRDFEVLKFLWRWKVTTTAVLITKFFPGCKPMTAYNRLCALQNNGIIRSRNPYHGQGGLWSLTDEGYERIRGKLFFLFDLKELGFKSEYPGHDLLVSALHNGEWLLDPPPGVEMFSEQELRRVNPEFYPPWVPRLQTNRPDGYFRVPIGNRKRTIAIEVELNQKAKIQYQEVARFYRSETGIERVIWLTDTQAFGRNLNSILKKEDDRESYPHAFVSFPEFKKLGWDAVAEAGSDAGKTIFEILYPGRESPRAFGGESRGSAPLPRMTDCLLNISKSPNKSIAPSFLELPSFSNR